MVLQYYLSGRLSQHMLWLACVAGVVGLLAARFLVALSPVVGVLAALANPQLRRDLPFYFRNGAAMRAAALVVFLVISGLYTSDWPVWRHELFRELTWLGVPIAFTLAVPLTRRQRLIVGCLFVLGTVSIGLATLYRYLLDPAQANEAIRTGQNMQAVTHIFHVPFGVMLTLTCFWAMLLRRHPLAGPLLRILLVSAAAAAFLTLHVLAYRTGLLSLYAGLVACAGWQLAKKRLAWGLGLLLLFGLAPWVAYRTLGSVQERVAATMWDIQQFQNKQDINAYSLSRRLAAVETACVVIGQHWLLGVGPADVHAAMMDQYEWRSYGLRPENRAEVHNQYLYALVGGGVLGLALWLAVLFWPLLQSRTWRNLDTCFFILVQAITMVIADMLSLQIGLNLFVFGYGFLVVARERVSMKLQEYKGSTRVRTEIFGKKI